MKDRDKSKLRRTVSEMNVPREITRRQHRKSGTGLNQAEVKKSSSTSTVDKVGDKSSSPTNSGASSPLGTTSNSSPPGSSGSGSGDKKESNTSSSSSRRSGTSNRGGGGGGGSKDKEKDKDKEGGSGETLSLEALKKREKALKEREEQFLKERETFLKEQERWNRDKAGAPTGRELEKMRSEVDKLIARKRKLEEEIVELGELIKVMFMYVLVNNYLLICLDNQVEDELKIQRDLLIEEILLLKEKKAELEKQTATRS